MPNVRNQSSCDPILIQLWRYMNNILHSSITDTGYDYKPWLVRASAVHIRCLSVKICDVVIIIYLCIDQVNGVFTMLLTYSLVIT